MGEEHQTDMVHTADDNIFTTVSKTLGVIASPKETSPIAEIKPAPQKGTAKSR